jgi:hypothetical protein
MILRSSIPFQKPASPGHEIPVSPAAKRRGVCPWAPRGWKVWAMPAEATSGLRCAPWQLSWPMDGHTHSRGTLSRILLHA